MVPDAVLALAAARRDARALGDGHGASELIPFPPPNPYVPDDVGMLTQPGKEADAAAAAAANDAESCANAAKQLRARRR